MARKLRIQNEGMIHHVLARGNKKGEIFKNNRDREKYIELIRKYKTRYEFKLYAYCLMNNHIHLLIEEGKISLSKIMQGIQQSYTQYINKKYNTTGHVFEQRYKSIPCLEERYLEKLIAYIHNNPVESGIVKKCEQYLWSGHNEIIQSDSNSIIDRNSLLSVIDGKNGIQNYTEILQNHSDLSEDSVKEVYFSNDDIEHKQDDIYFRKLKVKNKKDKTLEDLIGIINNHLRKDEKILYKKEYRKIFIPLAYRYGKFGRDEIACYLEISPSRVSNINRDYEEGRIENDFNDIIKSIIDEIDSRDKE